MAESYFLTDDEIQLLFALKFALYRKLNVNIMALIRSRLEIIMNKCKKNLFSSILKIQPMTFQTVKTWSRLWQQNISVENLTPLEQILKKLLILIKGVE